ncbi:MAG: T9SS type A sorting domain-containing protein [Bacteroidetes bacterium]|nr:T9SS type A sorting domain-containing protein [Bacteroidota bacterium]
MKKIIIVFFVLLYLLPANKADAQNNTYIVLSTVGSTDPFYQAAQTLATYRNAQIIVFNPDSVNNILPALISIQPRYVAVVIKPIQLHINFIRQFLMMSTNLDNDPFSDFSYGFITGATATDALNFVNKIILAENNNIQNYPLKVAGYAASSINFVYHTASDYIKYLNPASVSNIYLETSDSASGINFFLANTAYMSNNKLLDIGHNGDPHMLWLFDGGNSTPNPPVWNYDSTKIENPAYARVGLKSNHIGALNLYPAVAFNGACHSGEPKRVMVESDIMATFGNTQGLIKYYTMSDTFSFALSILKTGITGYFAPCGANNANDQAEEVYNAFLYHEPLGDIQKRTIDGVVMGFLGNRPNLKIYQQGGSIYDDDILASGTFNPTTYSGARSMLGGKANRIYFGDPKFNPYANNYSSQLNICHTTLDSINPTTLDINLSFHKPDVYEAYFPVWDKFHFSNTRIYTTVDLPASCSNISNFQTLSASAAYNLVINALEQFDSKNILHIEVDIPNDMYDSITFNCKFRLNHPATGISENSAQLSAVKVFPNPAKDIINIEFFDKDYEIHHLTVYNLLGEIVYQQDKISSQYISIDMKMQKPGLYFFSIENLHRETAYGKFIIE